MNPEIPDDCDLLFLYAPTSDITDDEKTIIEKYLSDGGKVYLILGDTTSDTPNLDGIMSDYGLKKSAVILQIPRDATREIIMQSSHSFL